MIGGRFINRCRFRQSRHMSPGCGSNTGLPGLTSTVGILLPDDKQQIFSILRNALQVCMRSWNDWLATVTANGRTSRHRRVSLLHGSGRYVYSILEQARKEPQANSIHIGHLIEDIILFTGKIEREPGARVPIGLRSACARTHGYQGLGQASYLDPTFHQHLPPIRPPSEPGRCSI
jgi:hypothetical protein